MFVRRGVYFVLTIMCMILIFSFSSKNSTSSDYTSKGLINQGISIYEKVFDCHVEHSVLVRKLNGPIRKLAHYSIYFLLGVFVYLLLFYSNIKHAGIFTFIVCFIYAVMDEVHQLYVPGRTGRVFDVMIDSSGVVAAIFILYFLFRRKKKQ